MISLFKFCFDRFPIFFYLNFNQIDQFTKSIFQSTLWGIGQLQPHPQFFSPLIPNFSLKFQHFRNRLTLLHSNFNICIKSYLFFFFFEISLFWLIGHFTFKFHNFCSQIRSQSNFNICLISPFRSNFSILMDPKIFHNILIDLTNFVINEFQCFCLIASFSL